ncbi:MAG: putative metal-binding motif-containing protein, partial [Patescibacteria group bacterium]
MRSFQFRGMTIVLATILVLTSVGCKDDDKDADGVVNEEDCAPEDPTILGADTLFVDADGDTFGFGNALTACPENPEDFVTNANDCDDQSAEVGAKSMMVIDSDADGFGSMVVGAVEICPTAGYLLDANDCNDGDPAINPNATDVCDRVDNNCDGETDEDCDLTVEDPDGDGHMGVQDCAPYNPDVHSDALELCDGYDNNCNGTIDEARECGGDDGDLPVDLDEDGVFSNVDCDDDDFMIGAPTDWFIDADSDGLGAQMPQPRSACDDPSIEGGDQFVTNSDDCDDTRVSIGVIHWYLDRDEDTFGDPATEMSSCTNPSDDVLHYVRNSLDCADLKPEINPTATEVCDDMDNDCDGTIDFAEVDGVAQSLKQTFYADTDHDGFGDASESQEACSTPSGHV